MAIKDYHLDDDYVTGLLDEIAKLKEEINSYHLVNARNWESLDKRKSITIQNLQEQLKQYKSMFEEIKELTYSSKYIISFYDCTEDENSQINTKIKNLFKAILDKLEKIKE